MRHLSIVSISALLIAGVVAAGCSADSPSAPMALAAPAAPLHSNAVVKIKAKELMRTSPLGSSVSVSANIGPLGGLLSLPAAGLTVIVPPFAVSKLTTFTITAHPGKPLEYDFAPAGTVFTVPLVATQDLTGTEAKRGGTVDPLALSVGYYPDPAVPTIVTEIVNVNVNFLRQTSTFLIWHFSGYMFSTGRDASSDF